MALGLAQYCPPSSTIHKIAPRLMTSLWDSLGEVYNPSLLNMAGPWDRGYGFCMTQYYATTGIHIAAIVGSENPREWKQEMQRGVVRNSIFRLLKSCLLPYRPDAYASQWIRSLQRRRSHSHANAHLPLHRILPLLHHLPTHPNPSSLHTTRIQGNIRSGWKKG